MNFSAEQVAALNRSPTAQTTPKLAYIMSRFPKLTETFVLYEILAVQQQGLSVEIYPLLKGHNSATQTSGGGILRKLWEYCSSKKRTDVMHPEAARLVKRARYQPFLSWRIISANLRVLCKEPKKYLGTFLSLVRGTWGSLNFFLGGIAIFPKSVYVAQLMSRDGVTHIHAHFANHPTTAAYIIHRISGIPYSFTAHGSDLHRDRHFLYEKVAEAAFVVTISDYNRRIIVEHCGAKFGDKVTVIHCGVDTNVFRPAVRATNAGGTSGPLSILCIGTLHEVKGQTHLVEACRRLGEAGVDFVLNLVGNGPDAAMLRQQVVQAQLEDRVLFHGCLLRTEIAKLLRSADMVVAPSVPTRDGRREGIPVVLMEAMSSGVAVVASDLSGIPELVKNGQSGILVPPGNVQALCDALHQLQADAALRHRLAQAAREKILHDFDLQKNVALLARHFHNPQSAVIRCNTDSDSAARLDMHTSKVGACC